jgi:hypothetical protein
MFPSFSEVLTGILRVWLTATPIDYLKLTLLVIVLGWFISRRQR